MRHPKGIPGARVKGKKGRRAVITMVGKERQSIISQGSSLGHIRHTDVCTLRYADICTDSKTYARRCRQR